MAVMLAPARRTLPASGAAVFLDKDGTLLQDVPYNVCLLYTSDAADEHRDV